MSWFRPSPIGSAPLSRLRFHVELLEGLPEEKRIEQIQAMARELDALDLLVSELLDCVQADDLELECQRFDPTGGLTNLVELVAHAVPKHRIVDVGSTCHLASMSMLTNASF